MRVIDAVYINTGGGMRLLEYLAHQDDLARDSVFLVDERVDIQALGATCQRVHASEAARRHFYEIYAGRLESVFCFANVPPPIRLRCPVKTYLHNRLFIEPPGLLAGGFAGIKYRAKQAYLRWRKSNTDTFVVQTQSMKSLCCAAFGMDGSKVDVWPFYDAGKYASLRGAHSRELDAFGFVSLPLLHKGHSSLLDAWEQLAAVGHYPKLHLTVPHEHALCRRINVMQNRGVKVVNHGYCDPAKIYSTCSYQIYPSSSESFGLGLIEAAEAGCKVIAPNLAYVSDVVKPSLTWDFAEPRGVFSAVLFAIEHQTPPTELRIKNEVRKITEFIHQK